MDINDVRQILEAGGSVEIEFKTPYEEVPPLSPLARVPALDNENVVEHRQGAPRYEINGIPVSKELAFEAWELCRAMGERK